MTRNKLKKWEHLIEQAAREDDERDRLIEEASEFERWSWNTPLGSGNWKIVPKKWDDNLTGSWSSEGWD